MDDGRAARGRRGNLLVGKKDERRRTAIDRGAGAQLNLGLMYEYGNGVVQDFVQAHKWYNLAASRVSASERDLRDKSVRNRDHLAARLSPTGIAEAQRVARGWRPTRILEFDFSTLPKPPSPDRADSGSRIANLQRMPPLTESTGIYLEKHDICRKNHTHTTESRPE